MGDVVPPGSLFWNFAVSESAEQEMLFRQLTQSQTSSAHFCSLWARCPAVEAVCPGTWTCEGWDSLWGVG